MDDVSLAFELVGTGGTGGTGGTYSGRLPLRLVRLGDGERKDHARASA